MSDNELEPREGADVELDSADTASKKPLSSRFVWTLWGMAFGGCFPVMALVIRFIQYEDKLMEVVASDPLIWIIMTAPVFLGLFAMLGGWQNDKVRDFSANLELKVKERTRELKKVTDNLEVQTQNQQSLLRGLTIGLFFFNSKGEIAPERSAALDEILPESKNFASIYEFFAHYTGTPGKTVDIVIDCLWGDSGFFSPFEGTMAMLGNEFEVPGEKRHRHIKLEFREQNSADGQLVNVIVMVNDVTEILRSEMEQKLQAERIKRISMAAANQESFRDFQKEAVNIIRDLKQNFKEPKPENLNLIKRQLHTLKGNCATFEFGSLARDIHHLEDIFADGAFDDQMRQAEKKWQGIKDRWKFETNDIDEVLGIKKSSDYVRIKREKLAAFMDKTSSNQALKTLSMDLLRYPSQEVMSKYDGMISSLALNNSKEVRLEFAPDCDEISYDELKTLDASLVHIFRNCVDHGIEKQDVREKIGKAKRGRIHVSCYRKDSKLHVFIKDDGRGMDLEILKNKAIEKNIWTKEKAAKASDREVLELIFSPSFSTAEYISETSGRGVGMDAVRSDIESRGGLIRVFSEQGVGSQFEIELPEVEPSVGLSNSTNNEILKKAS